MKKLISIVQIYALIAYLCTPALATTATRVTADSYEGGDNLLVNPNFQHSTITKGWTLGTGVTAAPDTSVKLGNDPQSLKLTLSSASGDLLYQDVTPKGSVNTLKLEAGDYINTSVSGLQICPRLSNTTITSGTSCTSIQANSVWQYWPANMVGGTGNVGVSLYAPSAVSGTVNVARAYTGIARNFSQASQAQDWGTLSYAATTGCNWGTTASAWNNFSNSASCPTPVVTGNLSAPASKIPGGTSASLPPGTYYVVAQSQFSQPAGGTGYFRLSDGTNSFGMKRIRADANAQFQDSIIGSITYNTPQTNTTFQVQGWGDGTNTLSISADQTSVGFGFIMKVYYFPPQSALGVMAGQQWQPTVTKLLSGSGTYTVPTGVSRLEIEMVGGGGGGGGSGTGGGTGGTGGNTTFGTSLLVANGGVGGGYAVAGGTGGTASVSAPAIQLAAVSGGSGSGTGGFTSNAPGGGPGAASPFGGAGGGGAGGSAGLAAVANTGSGGGGGGGSNVGPGSGGGAGGFVHAIINFPSSSYSYSVGAAGTAGTAGTIAAGGAGGSGAIIITEYYYAANAPQFPGQISSVGSGQYHHEFWNQYTSCTAGTCTATNQSGGYTSVVNSSHVYTATFNSAFSAPPSCTFTSGNGNAIPAFNTYPTSTSVQFAFFVSGVATDSGFTIDCYGPR